MLGRKSTRQFQIDFSDTPSSIHRRSHAMIPNLYILEKLMAERVQERQREIEQGHLLASLHTTRHSVTRRLIGNLGPYLIALGMRMKRPGQRAPHAVHSCREFTHSQKEGGQNRRNA